MTSETSLLICVLCHQIYRTGWTFFDPIPFCDSSLLYRTYRLLNNI